MTRNPKEIDKLEEELKLIMEARKEATIRGNLDPEAFAKRINQLFLFGSISEAAFRIANFLYGKETSLTPPPAMPFTTRGGC